MAMTGAIKGLKSIFILLVLLFGAHSVVFAQNFEELYGKELMSVPYNIKVTYMNTEKKPWSKTTYQERYNYLYARYQRQMAEDMNQLLKESDRQIRESNKQMEKQARKQAEAQKKYDKQLKKMNEELIEQNKKTARYLKSMDQKQKLLLLRQSSSNR